jgi:hypothetical protein
MRGERIAAPIFALLIVFSGAGGAIAPGASPVGTVEAQAGDGSAGACGAADWFLTFVSGTLLTTDCKTAGEVSEEWNETDAIQTRTQIHSQAGQLAAGNEQFLIGMDNALVDSNTIAFSKGEAAAVEVLANGGNESEAIQAANESIEDYYTVKQANTLDRWNVNIETVWTLEQRATNTTGVSDDFVTYGDEGNFIGSGSSGFSVTSTKITGSGTKTVALENGSSRQIKTLSVKISYSSSSDQTNEYMSFLSTANGGFSLGGTFEINSATDHTADQIRVRPTSNLSSKTVLDTSEFYGAWQDAETASNQTKEEVAVYVKQSLAPAVQNGELNATSYVSPATLAQEYAQDYNGSESYIRATAIAAFSGMDTPSLEETGSMTVTHDGTTYEGLLLSQEAPSGGWQSGETYDPALLSGLQMFAVAGANGSIVELDGSFTVEKITGTSGEEIQKATTVNVTYETSNASANYTELQQEIRSLNKQIEERQAQATSGGSGGGSGTNPLDALAGFLGVSAGAAVVVLIGAAAIVAKVYSPN